MEHNAKHLCPLCGQPNECAMAATGNPDAPCWCRETTINPAALAKAREISGTGSCICKRCAAMAAEVSKDRQ